MHIISSTKKLLCLFTMVLGLLILNGQSAYAVDPNLLMYDLNEVMQGNPESVVTPGWKNDLNPTFNSWAVTGSENIPLLAGAIGLHLYGDVPMKAGNPTTYVQWWLQFLRSQTGDQNPPQIPALRFFKGKELMSNTYEGYSVSAVLSVRYWARLRNNTSLANASLKWLKATWALYSLSAGRGPARWYSIDQYTDSAGNPVPQPINGQVNVRNQLYSNIPYLALAGARSSHTHYSDEARGPLLARAISWPGAFYREDAPQRAVLDWLQGRWNSFGAADNLYGLTSTEQNNLRNLINTGNGAASFMSWLTGLRTGATFRIMGWGGDYRASAMENNLNGNTVPTFGIAYNYGIQTAYFAYPWNPNSIRKGVSLGWCRLENGVVRASNEPAEYPHPLKIVTMPIPSTTPQFHLVLSRSAEPYLQTPVTFPPPPPPVIDIPIP